MSDAKNAIGKQIKEARKAKQLTQKQLAELIGVTQSVVAGYEAGSQNLTIDTLQKISDALKIQLVVRLG